MHEHQEGRHVEAERAYRALLAEDPDDAMRPLSRHAASRAGALEEACARAALGRADPPTHTPGTISATCTCRRSATLSERAYLARHVARPRLPAAWYNLARIYARWTSSSRTPVPAQRHAPRERIRRRPADSAHVYYRLGAGRCARGLQEWAEETADDPTPRHILAANSGQDVPERPTIATSSRPSTDSPIVSIQLAGSATAPPQLVAASLIVHPLYLTGRAAVLDAGCGTGWCGPLLRSTAGHLVGVDLSPHARAGPQRGVYDELHEAELTAFLVSGRRH